ncbi:MAG: hypothetical protein BWX80_02501 [Candidatus Hydrogenedentes bacterium ADurb.Bin101]|nr:MAG: hypothetical protein BWX80_02501 [Candidatus Hydrogenedentes bacterium ADurb.Bin101]
MGPGIVNMEPLFRRHSRVSQYVRERITTMDLEAWHREVEQFAKLDLSQSYRVEYMTLNTDLILS